MKTRQTIVLILLTCVTVQAQDAQFTQFFSSAVYSNPAFTGQRGTLNVTGISRWQWPQLAQINTKLISLDGLVSDGKVGLGLMLVQHTQDRWFKKTDLSGLFAYKMYGENLSVSMAIQPGISIKQYGAIDGVFVDQFVMLNNGSFAPTSFDPLATSLFNESYFTASTGVLFDYNPNNKDVPTQNRWWGGLSARHGAYPFSSNNILQASFAQRIFWSVHGGVQIHRGNTGDNQDDLKRESAVSLMFNLRNQYQDHQLDLFAQYSWSPLVMSVGYRGIPLRKVENHLQQDALIASLGFRVQNIQVQASYDLTISGLPRAGSYEVGIVYGISGPLFHLPYQMNEHAKKRETPCPDQRFTSPMW